MISKKQIEQYFKSVTLDDSSRHKKLNDPAWYRLYEYMVRNYANLDQGAKLFADTVFDALDGAIQEKIDSLPKGHEKRTATRKLSMVQGQRSPMPVLYLDTPVLEEFIKLGLGQPVPENAKTLYKKICQLVESRRLVYLENTFHREILQMGGARTQEGLGIIRKLSKALSFRHSQTIEDAQVFRTIQAYINENRPVRYRDFWTDALAKQTVLSIFAKRSFVVFNHQNAIIERGSLNAGQREDAGSSHLKIRFDAVTLKKDRDLVKRSARHLRDLVRLGMRFRTVVEDIPEAHRDVFWLKQKTDLSLALWDHLGGNPKGLEGLVSFFESDTFANVPAIRIKRDIWTAFSKTRIHSLEWPANASDIGVLAAVLPYTDIMILAPRMAHVVRDVLNLHGTFDTEILSMDEHEKALAALDTAPYCG